MNSRISLGALMAIASCALVTSCSTTESRISEHPEIFQSLSQRDQDLVRQGKIREGMTQDAVWIAWGAPNQKGSGIVHHHTVDTWIYNEFVYSNAPYPYPYGPYGYGGFYGGAVAFHNHHGRRFVIVGSPFYDPFYYSYLSPRIAYPAKTVSFVNGRVVSIQILSPPST